MKTDAPPPPPPYLRAGQRAARAIVLLRQYRHERPDLRRQLRRLVSQNLVLVKQHLGNVSGRAGVGLQDRSDAGFKLWLLDAVNVVSCCVSKQTGEVREGMGGQGATSSTVRKPWPPQTKFQNLWDRDEGNVAGHRVTNLRL